MIYSIIITFIAAMLFITLCRAMIRCGNYEYRYHLLKAEIVKLKKELQPLINIKENTNIVIDPNPSPGPANPRAKRVFISSVGSILVSNCGTCPLHTSEYSKAQNQKGRYYSTLSCVRCSRTGAEVPFFTISQNCPLPLEGEQIAVPH